MPTLLTAHKKYTTELTSNLTPFCMKNYAGLHTKKTLEDHLHRCCRAWYQTGGGGSGELSVFSKNRTNFSHCLEEWYAINTDWQTSISGQSWGFLGRFPPDFTQKAGKTPRTPQIVEKPDHSLASKIAGIVIHKHVRCPKGCKPRIR